MTVCAPHSLSVGPPVHLQFQQSPSGLHKRRRRSLLRNGGGGGGGRSGEVLLAQSNRFINSMSILGTFIPFNNIVNRKFNSSSAANKATATGGADGGGSGRGSDDGMLEVMELREIKDKCKKWNWKGKFAINYFVSDPNPQQRQFSYSNPKSYPPLLLVHGFGASIPHWRRNIRTLSQIYTVYAIDLLGFGASDKPIGFSYTMEKWAELILDFLAEIVQEPTVLIGNSVGSLACVIAATECDDRALVRGLVLLNCAGGMNNKAIVDDWRIKLLLPLLWLIDLLLNQRRIASALFARVKQRDNIKSILLSVYGNKESVDEELVEIIVEPTCDPGALDAFVSIVTGPPGPSPVQLMPRISSIPLLILWGDQDPFTPLDGPIGRFFASLPSQLPDPTNVSLFILQGVGHCPHDDRPELVHEKLLPWLVHLSSLSP